MIFSWSDFRVFSMGELMLLFNLPSIGKNVYYKTGTMSVMMAAILAAFIKSRPNRENDLIQL